MNLFLFSVMKQLFQKYLSQSLSKHSLLNYTEKPEVIVVIPAYNEPDIFKTFESLMAAKSISKVLILTVVNYSERASEEVKAFNQHLYHLIVEWGIKHSSSDITFDALFISDIRRKHAGAGYARKVGMDTATEIFSQFGNEKGIIVSLDADCTLDNNYFTTIVEYFNTDCRPDLQVIDFEQDKLNLAKKQQIAMLQYELYLHYFVIGIRLSGFPYAYQTIGSCFAVTVDAYVKNGGMNRKHAGEDFYFLHKLFPNCKVKRNYDTAVHPSGRLSDRVPFGTGPALNQIMSTSDPYRVYNPEAFKDLKQLFNEFYLYYERGLLDNSGFSDGLTAFLLSIDIQRKLGEARQNSGVRVTFLKRLFRHFDAFQIVKFLNFVHENGFYEKLPVLDACNQLFRSELNAITSEDEMLDELRKLERTTNLHLLE